MKSRPGADGQAAWAKRQGRKLSPSSSHRNSVLQPKEELPSADPTRFPQNIPHVARRHQEEATAPPGRDGHLPPMRSRTTSDPHPCLALTAFPETPRLGSSTPDLPLSNVSRLPARASGRQAGWPGCWFSATALVCLLILSFHSP